MISVGTVNPLSASPLTGIETLRPPALPTEGVGAPGAGGFTKMLDGLVATVDAKQDLSQAMAKRVLLGESDQLHQSVIAMQEASVAFGLMVEVRNKLVESYQELMRMQV
jgi:flagellar hook-basal body complex protein FliE